MYSGRPALCLTTALSFSSVWPCERLYWRAHAPSQHAMSASVSCWRLTLVWTYAKQHVHLKPRDALPELKLAPSTCKCAFVPSADRLEQQGCEEGSEQACRSRHQGPPAAHHAPYTPKSSPGNPQRGRLQPSCAAGRPPDHLRRGRALQERLLRPKELQRRQLLQRHVQRHGAQALVLLAVPAREREAPSRPAPGPGCARRGGRAVQGAGARVPGNTMSRLLHCL